MYSNAYPLFHLCVIIPQARRQAEAVAGVLKNVRGQLDGTLDRLKEAENSHMEAMQKERNLQEDHGKVLTALARGRMQVCRRLKVTRLNGMQNTAFINEWVKRHINKSSLALRLTFMLSG